MKNVEYVEYVRNDGDTVTVSRSEWNKLCRERDEYRDIALSMQEHYNAIKKKFLSNNSGVAQ